MPLIAVAALVYAAALLAGLGGVLVPGVGLSAAAALWGAWAGRAAPAALAVLALAGVVSGASAARRTAVCGERLALARELTLLLEDDARPGVVVPARVRSGRCAARALVAVVEGRGAGGDVVVARGLFVPGARGGFVRHARLGARTGGVPLVALRTAARRAIDRAFGADAPLARALLIADTRTLPPELRDRFADAGLVHMLSISGLHVAIVAGAIQLVCLAARAPRRAAAVAAVAATAVYVAVIGAPAPAVRSGAMLAMAAAAQLAQRPTSPWAPVAVGAIVPMALDPATVRDLGFQLSVVGVAGLVASGALARRLLAPRWSGWRLTVGRELLASVVAAVVSLPLVAWSFGRVSLVAPVANLAAGPLVAVLQPTLFLALLLAPLPPLARFVAGAAHPLLAAFDLAARLAAAVPFAALHVAPTLAAAWLCGALSAALVLACVARHPGRPLVAGAGAVAALAWLPSLPTGSGTAELHMIDVGQGDALAVRTPRGRWLLFDAGGGWRTGDAGRATVVPYIRRRGGDVAAFVLSHPHLDHVGGAASVLRALRPAAYWDAAFAGGGDAYRASLALADTLGVPWRRVHPGDTLAADGVVVRFLAPDSVWTAALRDPNEASTVALVRFGAVRFLLVGDAERGEEGWLLRHAARELRADVLKVGHHGSRTSSSPAFLAAVRPRLALVSAGLGNSYGHPDAGVLAALAAAGADVVRSDVVGSAVVRTDGHAITLELNGLEWPLAPASVPASGASPPAPPRR